MSSLELNKICDNEDTDEYDTYEELEKIFKSADSSDKALEDLRNVSQNTKKQSNKRVRKKEEPDKITKKQMLEQKRQLKKLEKEQEKMLKMTMKDIKKSTSKEHCIKYIIVKLDESIEQESYGEIIKTTLAENNISYQLVKSEPDTITWSRRILSLDEMVPKESILDEKNFLLILTSKMFESLVKRNNLIDYIRTFFQKNDFEHLTVVVFGMKWPNRDQELAIMKVERIFKCYWNYFKNSIDLACFVLRATKSIAQIPYSREQEEKYQSQYFDDSNKNKIKIDKDGNGIDRLWKQMITMFPGVRLEIAEVITAKYPTLSSLLKAYEECDNKEQLIQDLPRRNPQGSSNSSKKIGPELSKKFAKFFTSEEDILL